MQPRPPRFYPRTTGSQPPLTDAALRAIRHEIARAVLRTFTGRLAATFPRAAHVVYVSFLERGGGEPIACEVAVDAAALSAAALAGRGVGGSHCVA